MCPKCAFNKNNNSCQNCTDDEVLGRELSFRFTQDKPKWQNQLENRFIVSYKGNIHFNRIAELNDIIQTIEPILSRNEVSFFNMVRTESTYSKIYIQSCIDGII